MKHYTIIINGREIFHGSLWYSKTLLEENEISEEINKKYTWDDFENGKILFKYNGISAVFWRFFKKKRLYVYGIFDRTTVYELGEDELEFIVHYHWEETNCSINEILAMKDNEKAIHYLVERGMTAINELK